MIFIMRLNSWTLLLLIDNLFLCYLIIIFGFLFHHFIDLVRDHVSHLFLFLSNLLFDLSSQIPLL